MAAPIVGNNISNSVEFVGKVKETLIRSKDRTTKTKESAEVRSKCKEYSERCENLLSKLTADGEPVAADLPKYLQQFIPIVLDVTFIDENKLVDDEFPPGVSIEIIQNILDELDGLLTLGQHIEPNKHLRETIGGELLECIYWRKGALLYMYCKTIESNTSRIKHNLLQYKQYLVNGVKNLKSMLETREPVVIDNDTESQNDDTLNLIKSGIYSDTHLLSLVYAGEMCYWLNNCDKLGYFQTEEIDYKYLGETYLSLYLQVVNGPLIHQGWNTDSAQSMLHSFKS